MTEEVDHLWSPRVYSDIFSSPYSETRVVTRVECEFCRSPENLHPPPDTGEDV